MTGDFASSFVIELSRSTSGTAIRFASTQSLAPIFALESGDRRPLGRLCNAAVLLAEPPSVDGRKSSATRTSTTRHDHAGSRR
jgi:hypothetical protein